MQLGLNILAMCVSALPFLVLIAWFLVRAKAPALGAELLKYILPSHSRELKIWRHMSTISFSEIP